jgi:hypothetical protein
LNSDNFKNYVKTGAVVLRWKTLNDAASFLE